MENLLSVSDLGRHHSSEETRAQLSSSPPAPLQNPPLTRDEVVYVLVHGAVVLGLLSRKQHRCEDRGVAAQLARPL